MDKPKRESSVDARRYLGGRIETHQPIGPPLLTPRNARRLFAVYAVLMCAVLLQPQPTVAAGGVGWLDDLLQHLGAPATLTATGRVEALVNTVLFIPPSALALLVFPRLRWSDVVVAGFVGSLAVELIQGLILSDRSAQAIDVVANTSGALIGALVGLAVLRKAQRRRPIEQHRS